MHLYACALCHAFAAVSHATVTVILARAKGSHARVTVTFTLTPTCPHPLPRSHANFETFLHSMAILFRCSTGESWDGIMQDTTVVDSCCYILRDIPALGLSEGDWVNGPQGQLPNVNTLGLVQDTDYRFQCTNGYAYSVIFFISFVLFVSLVLLNLIVAIILDNFTATTEDESLVVNKAHVQEFR